MIKTKKKAKKASDESIEMHTTSAGEIYETVGNACEEADTVLLRRCLRDAVSWSVEVIRADSPTIKRQDGSEGALCDKDIDERVEEITDAERTAADSALPAKAKARWDAGFKALLRVATLLRVALKLFLGRKANQTPSFDNAQRKAIENAHALSAHLVTLQLIGNVGVKDPERDLMDFLEKFIDDEWTKVKAASSTEVNTVLKAHLVEADMKIQPDEKDIKALKASITMAGQAAEMVDMLVTALDLRIDVHTYHCMKRATASNILGRIMTAGRAIKCALPALKSNSLLQEEDEGPLVARLDGWLEEAVRLAAEKVEAFQDSMDQAIKEAKAFLDKCPDVSDENSFIDYLLKKNPMSPPCSCAI